MSTVIVAKLVTGEEVVCRVTEETEVLYTDIMRLQAMMTPQGQQMILVPWMTTNPHVELNEDTWGAITIVDAPAPASLERVYLEMTSGIQIAQSTPPASVLELVKG